MIPLRKTFYQLCFTGLFSLAGCHRDVPIPLLETEDVRNVVFKLSGFESEVTSLSARDIKGLMGIAGVGMQSLYNIVPSPESQYLYYWSFNDETLEPDIAVDEDGAGITFEASGTEADFVNGFSLDPFVAGRALKLKGAKSLIISFPVITVELLTELSFDIKSSDTGPKDFSISCSTDGGVTYNMLRASNQFEKTKDSQWNQYTFDVSEFSNVDVLQLKLSFLEGNRGDGGKYNETTGIVHLDNIRISGIYNGEPETEIDSSMPSTLRYYVFSSDDGRVIAQEELLLSEMTEDGFLKMKLSQGTYDVLLLAYRSDEGLLLPEDLTNANEFYFGQDFDDYQAITYAALKRNFEVGSADVSESAVLTRCFSLVTFDFTDLWPDLTEVKKIDITRQHEDYLYTPYGEPIELPMSDLHTITFDRLATEENYQLTFHQFLGMPDGVQNVSYELTAYGMDGEELNTVSVSEDIRNNVQLRFRGRLLGNRDRFSIEIVSDWEETIEHAF